MNSKRVLDILLSSILLILLIPVIAIVTVLIKLTSNGSVVHISKRIGRNNKPFLMFKFRTMTIDAPNVETNLLIEPHKYITKIGAILRKTSLDEIPQLWNIVIGQMSFVGPRPALYNQKVLILMRTNSGLHLLTPGLTGWAQVNGRDELNNMEKIKFDKEYDAKKNIYFDIYIILLTIIKVFRKDGVIY